MLNQTENKNEQLSNLLSFEASTFVPLIEIEQET